jgi:hypothetical protein
VWRKILTGRRHYPEEFAQTAELGVDRFDKRSAAEMERDFPAMVRAGSPWQVNDNAAQQLPVGEHVCRWTAKAYAEQQLLCSSLLALGLLMCGRGLNAHCWKLG